MYRIHDQYKERRERGRGGEKEGGGESVYVTLIILECLYNEFSSNKNTDNTSNHNAVFEGLRSKVG